MASFAAMQALDARIDHLVACGWFWVWAVVGFGFAIGFVSLGVLSIAPAALAATLLAAGERSRHSAYGLLTGIGALCLLVAWIQRDGSGLHPGQWLFVGIAFALAGVVAHLRHED